MKETKECMEVYKGKMEEIEELKKDEEVWNRSIITNTISFVYRP